MIWAIAGGLVILVVAGFIWGVLHLRQSQRVASEAIARVSLSDLPKLCAECETVFADSFNEQLSHDELENSARILSARLDQSESLKKAFAKPEFYWYFVLPLGAYLGRREGCRFRIGTAVVHAGTCIRYHQLSLWLGRWSKCHRFLLRVSSPV